GPYPESWFHRSLAYAVATVPALTMLTPSPFSVAAELASSSRRSFASGAEMSSTTATAPVSRPPRRGRAPPLTWTTARDPWSARLEPHVPPSLPEGHARVRAAAHPTSSR